MKVAWVTHRDLSAEGGAEAADREMLDVAPDDITTIDHFRPGSIDEEALQDYDKVVLTGLYGFSSRELNVIARRHPVFWVHDTQFSGHWIYGECELVICLTPQHIDYEIEKLPILQRDRMMANPGTMNLREIPIPADGQLRNGRALWAHRPVYHKGLDLAAEWAEEKGIPLDVMVGHPRTAVLQAMRRASYFVLLSYIMDPGPRAVIEAQLLGCELVVNENVGFFDLPPDHLRSLIETADVRFWDAVMS